MPQQRGVYRRQGGPLDRCDHRPDVYLNHLQAFQILESQRTIDTDHRLQQMSPQPCLSLSSGLPRHPQNATVPNHTTRNPSPLAHRQGSQSACRHRPSQIQTGAKRLRTHLYGHPPSPSAHHPQAMCLPYWRGASHHQNDPRQGLCRTTDQRHHRTCPRRAVLLAAHPNARLRLNPR